LSKRKKIIIIAVSVTLALVMGVGGVGYAMTHTDWGGHKLIGVGEMGNTSDPNWSQYQEWDTWFTITNPNCDKTLTIEWVSVIDQDENPVWEGPGPGELSPHEVWQLSLAGRLPGEPDTLPLKKYTVEVTWSGAAYSWWLGWGRVRPLIGWQKEKCWSEFHWDGWEYDFPAFSISEAPMQLFPSKMPVKLIA